ncbi:hypothetical protein [Pleomorphovibrio marinus]|nr:hypothetical protein [Pleomorphovibrio marinus]
MKDLFQVLDYVNTLNLEQGDMELVLCKKKGMEGQKKTPELGSCSEEGN